MSVCVCVRVFACVQITNMEKKKEKKKKKHKKYASKLHIYIDAHALHTHAQHSLTLLHEEAHTNAEPSVGSPVEAEPLLSHPCIQIKLLHT
jgi:hypothetical protein